MSAHDVPAEGHVICDSGGGAIDGIEHCNRTRAEHEKSPPTAMPGREELGRVAYEAAWGPDWYWGNVDADNRDLWCRAAEAVKAAVLASPAAMVTFANDTGLDLCMDWREDRWRITMREPPRTWTAPPATLDGWRALLAEAEARREVVVCTGKIPFDRGFTAVLFDVTDGNTDGGLDFEGMEACLRPCDVRAVCRVPAPPVVVDLPVPDPSTLPIGTTVAVAGPATVTAPHGHADAPAPGPEPIMLDAIPTKRLMDDALLRGIVAELRAARAELRTLRAASPSHAAMAAEIADLRARLAEADGDGGDGSIWRRKPGEWRR